MTVVWIAFGPAIHHEFVNYDDDHYVYNEPKVLAGLSLSGAEWAFTHSHADNWHPLTTLSHMLDVQLYGLNASGHHLTNILLHALATVLLFLALRKLTAPSTLNAEPSTLWICGFVAALFAVHPLRVESVAWIAERKDVLSGVFFALTLFAYARYVRSQESSRRRWYVATVIVFGLGLMCKPTLVTVPFVLLLLDYWPLNRMQSAKDKELGAGSTERREGSRGRSGKREAGDFSTSLGGLVVEKIPLFVLSAISCLVTLLVQTQAVAAIEGLPLQQRIANAAVSYVTYLWQSVYPAHLSVLYPYPLNHLPTGEIAAASLLLLMISVAVVVWRDRLPYLFSGWFWFLGMLVPAIGLVQVGSQAHADRYTYLPQIGLWIIVSWAITELAVRWRVHGTLVATIGVAIILVLAALSRREMSYWQNGETLWTHAIRNTDGNYIAHNNFANWLLQRGRFDEALEESRKALAINANLEEGHVTLGNIFIRTNHPDAAVAEYQVVLQHSPDFSEVRSNLGNILLDKGQTAEAIAEYKKALETSPQHFGILSNLGNALVATGRATEAIGYFEKALEINPKFPEAENNLGNALFQLAKVDEAIAHFGNAVALKPDYPQAEYNLGNAWLRKGDNAQAITHFQRALQIKPDYAEAKYNLAKAFAATGDYTDAIAASQAAIHDRPDFVPAYNNLGCFFGALGDSAEAIRQFNEALKLDPNFVDARYNLGHLLVQLGRKREAVEQLQQVLQVDPNYADTKQLLRDLGTPVP